MLRPEPRRERRLLVQAPLQVPSGVALSPT